MNFLRRVRRTCVVGASIYVTSSVFFNHVVSVAACDGRSMEPAIMDGNWVMVHRNTSSVDRNDVVLLRSPQNPHEFLVKRVTKLEGERIDKTGTKPWVPRGHVWLEGDNKEMSLDSRDYGPVPKGLITGKVFFTFWPLSRTGFITPPLRPTSLVETLKAEADQDPWADDVDDDVDDADHSAHSSAESAEKA